MPENSASKEAIRTWLLGYAWAEDTEAEKTAIVDCIMHQDGWKYISTVADQYAGAQWEPGPVAFKEGEKYAMSALYEAHDRPHLATCPNHRPDEPCIHIGVFALEDGPGTEYCPGCDQNIDRSQL